MRFWGKKGLFFQKSEVKMHFFAKKFGGLKKKQYFCTRF